MRRLGILTCAAVPLAALLAACGSSGPTGTTTGTSSPESPVQAAFKYAQCMRSHGVTGFPDPHVTTTQGSGEISQALPASAAAAPKFKSASKACAGIEPGPGAKGPGSHGPNKQDLLAFAQCLRAHGISGFPDPNVQGRLNLQAISAAGVDYHSHTFEVAADSCVSVTHGAITAALVAQLVNHY